MPYSRKTVFVRQHWIMGDNMIKKWTIGFVFLLSMQVYAGNKPNDVTIKINPDQKNYIGLVMPDHAINLLQNQSFLNSVFPSMEDVAKKACGYKIRPQSITISVGIISVTWETDKLCSETSPSAVKPF